MKNSPCLACDYISDDKRACMLHVHMGAGIPIDFNDGYDDDEHEEIDYPEECFALDDLRETMARLIDNLCQLKEQMGETWDWLMTLEEKLRGAEALDPGGEKR